jgi:tetratricopeptide (TPR) repeat protein/transcriptional regulator with XRE-family HTH domain
MAVAGRCCVVWGHGRLGSGCARGAGTVAEQLALSFAGLVRQLRAEAGLTQEELAEAAGLPVRTLSDLERGISRTAHKDTAGLLADALGLAGPARVAFIAVARGKAPAAEVLAGRDAEAPGAFAAATRALPRDIASFTGRQAELARMLEALATTAGGGGVVGIHAIDGMAGVGKTTFAVHAAHQLAGTFPDGQFFLPLHAHTPGRQPVEPADALASLLLTAGVAAAHIPPGVETRAARWRDQVAGKKILLVLDDAAGHEQVTPLLPGTAGSLVLVTSRRRLAALPDTAVISLDTLPPAEAALLLVRLAARPGLQTDDEAAGEITRLCGYLPLAIGMLASQLRHHPTWIAGQLAEALTAARDRLALMHAENLSVAAAFDLSYADLSPGPQRLFRRLGLIPGPGFDAHAVASLDGTSLDAARQQLADLYEQHLITEPAPDRYQLHDLLREHARALAAADDPAESDAATGRLLDYYLHTAAAGGVHFRSWARTYRHPPAGRSPGDGPGLSELGRATAWLEVERPNLHAAVDYAAATGRSVHAVQIPAAMSGFLTARGLWDESRALHQTALAAAQESGDRGGQAIAQGELGVLGWLAGDFPEATSRLADSAALYSEIGDLPDQSYILTLIGYMHRLTGDCPAAFAAYQQALELARRAGDALAEAEVLVNLGETQHLTGDYQAATASQERTLRLYREAGDQHGEAMALNDLGTIYQETGEYSLSAVTQRQALGLFRDLGDRLGQAIALNDLGIVQRETEDYHAAESSHQQALAVFRDFGHRLGQAEALNRLGDLSTRTSATGQARDRHTRALDIAQDIGVPLEEAHALEGLGHSHLQDGNPGQAAAYLRQALLIYQRIGAHAAQRVQETLRRHRLPCTTPQSQPAAPGREDQQPCMRTAPPESQ